MPFSRGQVVNNRYRITNPLSQGGFGIIYRAWDLSLKRPCAIKTNLDSSPQGREQFEYEARVLANLHHPNLARVIDYFFVSNNEQCLVMDFVEGEDLQTLLDRNGPVPHTQALTWVSQICTALDYIHKQDPPVIHRDIKPANIRISPDGKAMLVDFGIAKEFDHEMKTKAGARAVTPGYSPIEQYGGGRTDARSDLYALGSTLYTLLTAQEPPESVHRMMDTPLPPPRSINPAISPSIERVILKVMEIQPEKRYQTALDFQQAIITHASRPILAPSQTRATWVFITLGLLLLVNLIAIVSRAFEIYLLSKIIQGADISATLVTANDVWQNIISLVQIGLLIITGAAFMLWIYRTYGNLKSHLPKMKFSPGWAAGGFLVPFLNLVHPYQVVSEIWKVGVTIGQTKTGERASHSSTLVAFWWLLVLASGFSSLIARYLAGTASTFGEIGFASQTIVASNVVNAIAAGITFLVVSKINALLKPQRRARPER